MFPAAGNEQQILRLYEKDYEFRFCGVEEIEDVVRFIDQYWQKGHIFTKSRALLDWQHLDRRNNRYNFVLAVNRRTAEIHAMIGFILTSFYDEAIATPMRWGALWKMREDVGAKGLGLAVKCYLQLYAPAPYIGGVGLSHYSRDIDKKLGESVGLLNPYYMLNAWKDGYALVDNAQGVHFQKTKNADGCFVNLTEETFLTEKAYFSNLLPYKSALYYVNRYFRHPIYKYGFTELRGSDGKEQACLVWRLCSHLGHRCICVVDYIGTGEELSGHYGDFQKLLIDADAEYISFYNYGIKTECILDGGFQNRRDSDLVLPLYYEPFVMKNVDLDYHYYSIDSANSAEIFFKGDADQDRPSTIDTEE